MADIGKAYVQIIPSASGMEAKIKELLGDDAEQAGRSSGQKAGSALVSALKGAAVAAGIGTILKDAFEAGGDLQQSFGGLDTIYGSAAEQAKQFAVEAASAGISANTYAEQAVAFGASLKQAFGGDTTAAMEAANTAIMDMADNSAKMGTDIGSIQTAYQGFAKQNYTMLDNLKLGYGGTKEEMERLLADAQKLSGVEYNIDNLGDVYEAIHVIQGELGLTGVAAEEASTTLTGSFGAMKASWQNLFAAMTTGQGMDAALSNLGTSVGNVLNNLVTMAGSLVSQLPAVLTGIVTQIGPTMLQSGVTMVLDLISGVAQGLPQLVTAATELFDDFLIAIVAAIPQLVVVGGQLLNGLVNGIIQAIPQLIATVIELIPTFITSLIQGLPDLIETGIELLLSLLSGIILALPELLLFPGKMFEDLINIFSEIDWADLGSRLIDGIITGLRNAATNLYNAVRSIIRNALGAGQSEAEVGSPSRLFARELGQWIPAGTAEGIEENIAPVQRSVRSMIDIAAADYSSYMSAQPLPIDNTAPQTRASTQGGEIKIRLVFDESLDSLARALHPRLEVVGNAHGVKLIN